MAWVVRGNPKTGPNHKQGCKLVHHDVRNHRLAWHTFESVEGALMEGLLQAPRELFCMRPIEAISPNLRALREDAARGASGAKRIHCVCVFPGQQH